MTDTSSNPRWLGFIVVPLLLVYAVVYAALPFIVSLVAVILVPGVGELRADISGWSLLHFLWVIPALFVLESFTHALARIIERRTKKSLPGNILGATLEIVALTLLSSVFFVDLPGALLAAVIGFALSLLVQKLVPDNDDSKAKRADD